MKPIWQSRVKNTIIGSVFMSSSDHIPMMSLVLVYAGTPTIFANFRTFIRLDFIIFHCYIALYIATLCCTSTLHSMSQLYVMPLPHNPMLQFYIALLCHTYITSLLPCSITSPPPHVTPRD